MVRSRNVPFWSVAVNTFLVHHSISMKQTDPQYKLRLPQELKDQVEEAAKQSGRSMNAEIVARLESSFVPSPGLDATAAFLEYQLVSEAYEKFRQQRHDAHFAKAVEGLVAALEKKVPELVSDLQGEISQVQFFARMYPPVPDEALSLTSEMRFLMDKRQALIRHISLGHSEELFSYPDELKNVEEEIARAKERLNKIALPKRPLV